MNQTCKLVFSNNGGQNQQSLSLAIGIIRSIKNTTIQLKGFLILLWAVSIFLPVLSQSNIQLTHYSADEGLSENNVLSILQDRKGIMWFGTYDGLNKFDGYTFKTYKGNPDDHIALLNYRIDRIREDCNGYLWVQTYDGRIYRFNPRTEKFLPVPQCLPEYKNYRISLTGLFALNDSSIWITGGEHGDDDCFRILNTNDPNKVQVTHFTTSNGQLTANKVKKIYLDKGQNTWILTTNGVTLLKKKASKTIQFFKGKSTEPSSFLAICENFPFIYLGGGQGQFKIYDSRKETFENVVTHTSAAIIDIQKITPNELFILTDKNGFYLFDLKTKKIVVFNKLTLSGLNSDNFNGCYLDKKQNVWLSDDNMDVALFKSREKKLINFNNLSEKTPGLNFFVFEDNKNNIWVHPRKGGFSLYDSISNKLEPFFNDPTSADRKFSNNVRTVFSDLQGNLWICPYNYGIEKVVFRSSPFNFYKPNPGLQYSDLNQVRSIFRDKDSWLWVGTKNGYLYLFDENNHLMGRLGADGKLNSPSPFNAPVYNIMSDHTGTIWLGTKGKGLFKVIKKNNSKFPSFSLTNYQNEPNDAYSLSFDAVYSVFEDHLHRLWVATYGGGINLMEIQNGQVRFLSYKNKLKNYPMQFNRTRYVTEDSIGRLYVGTTEGLVAFQYNENTPENVKFYHYSHVPEDKQSISGNDVHYILPSKNGNLYLGIYGGGFDVLENGLNFSKKPNFKAFKKNNGIPSDVVFTLQEDFKGNIWLSTQTKLVKFEPKSEKFDVYSPVTSNSYSFIEGSVCKTLQGDLIYGTTEGFVLFNPLKAAKSQFIPRIVFTHLQLLNKPIEVGTAGSPLYKTLDDINELKLTHKQNIISISFSALDYSDPQEIHYAYKLDGIDADWNFVGNQRVATYTNLPKGSYTFRVKSTNADGEWVNNERTLLIKKSPSFWQSYWGVVFYFIVFLGITVLATYILFTIYRLKNDVVVEHRITEMKLRFFTDISHELRTPLTLISSPVENILRKETLSVKVKEQLTVVKRNTERMLRLINQILDFHKIQSKKMTLEVEDIHVNQLINEICSNFKKLAEERNIALRVLDNSNKSHLWVDRDKFEKIFYNLLSNAFKFTQSGNSVEVNIQDEPECISISVNDKGVGIEKEKLKRIFNRFENLGSNNNSVQPSSGIGLSLTKELVELHKATINVESELGKGSSFKVVFLKGHDHFNNSNDYVLSNSAPEEASKISVDSLEIINDEEQKSVYLPELPTILIVEDNSELRNFLSSVLRTRYNVLEAENGKEALKILPDSSPDLIVSDIMMPEMTGLEFAKIIKEDINTSHIPLVLLTAKNDIDSKLEAMDFGVDDYITKPFSSAYLEARIENLLRLRKQLQEYYRSSLTSGVISIPKPNTTSQDDVFIQRIMKYIEEHIEDSELSIDGIALFIGLSRSSMFKKIKSLTGLAPVDFIKEIRIQRAAQLIETGEYNVSQVAYMIGMTDPRYFSKCFKLKYGVTPREYKEKCQS